MKVVVTGATGFVGGRVARLLRARGHEVVAIVRDPDRAGGLKAMGVELVRGDVTEPESLVPPMRGAGALFHVAGWYKLGVRDRRPARRINVDGTRNVLEAMRAAKVTRGVYTSTLAVHGNTHGRLVDETYRHGGPWASEYDRTKWAAHYEVALPMMKAGLPLTVVMPGLVYGPGDTSSVRTTLLQFLKRELPMVPGGAAYCWAHVDDVAMGHLLALEHGREGECYHLAGPPWTIVEALKLAETISGVKGPGRVVPPALLRVLSLAMAVVEKVTPVSEQMSAENLRVLAGGTYLGLAIKAQRDLGWQVRSLEDGLRETLFHEMALLGMRLPVD